MIIIIRIILILGMLLGKVSEAHKNRVIRACVEDGDHYDHMIIMIIKMINLILKMLLVKLSKAHKKPGDQGMCGIW